ncbi:TlpA family protein disulfide reductase [Bizionia argentinensis JUB59]|uniref:TlpA family protein disulfide reductase n=1 Tax=Bizionia argentinensis JUB59 TaxID=1046627 RepID=G2EHM3_9FLAO|nr:TlpA disulfide reductase family protein [Bizionia argentinensis]EGV42077.1 TlpA family protein disulfide reductase [Bizionia argentinensis JUB59]
MKKLLIIALVCLVASCGKNEQPPKDYAVIHGSVKNAKDSISLRLYNPETSLSMMLELDDKGNFRDTLKLEEPNMFNAVYGNVFTLYLKNDMDLKIDFDAEEIQKTITFSGKGEEENNFLKYKGKHISGLFGKDYKNYLGLPEDEFKTTTDKFLADFNSELESKSATLDSSFVAEEKAGMEEFETNMIAQHKEQLEINSKLGKGNPSPNFLDFKNYAGGTSSLADFKGSYVYIDVWATWCVPCIYEIPFLQKVEKEFEGKNITFLSISADQMKDEDKWRKMIVDKNLHGVQLLADNAIESQFFVDYYIYGIPRFILLDPEGNIVTYDAPRPSEEKLTTLLNTLDL